MVVSMSLPMLVVLSSLAAGPTEAPAVAGSPTLVREGAASPHVTPLPPSPSAFVPELEKAATTKDQLAAPAQGANKSDRSNKPAGGWIKRIVSDWLHRGNRSESAPDFFQRLRQQERQAGDALLVSRCKALLLSDPSLRSLFIHVSANDGVVELRGHVPTDSVKEEIERIARQTPGMADLRSELTVGSVVAIQQASYVGASLLPPIDLSSSSSLMPGDPTADASRRSAATLGSDIESVSDAEADSLPMAEDVAPLLTWNSLPMPPSRHQTIGLRAAKNPVQAETLPSGQRLLTGNQQRPSIPAPPASTSVPTIPTARVVQRSNPTSAGSADPLTQQIAGDVAAVLARDPRAQRITYELRGRELRLAGFTRTPEDLYAIASVLGQLPGIDFVHLDDVQFQP